MNINKFFKECIRRGVFKLLSIYIVSSWVLLQVLALIADPIGLPEKSVSVLILILIIGFPLNVILIWKQKLSLSWASDEDDTSQELLDKSKFRQMYFTSTGIIIFLAGFAATLIFNNNFSGELKLPKIQGNDKIVVLKFDNLTSNDSLNIVGDMAANWISHGITENNAGQVISQDILKDYTSAMTTQNKSLTNNDILTKFFNPGKRITGSYFLNNNELIFQCSIIEGVSGRALISFNRVSCNPNSPLKCIEDLRQEIVGYLADKELGDLSLENNPPKYEAYKALLEAKTSKRENNLIKYLELLNKSIEIDSEYFEPKSLRIGHYYNQDEFKIADSLIKNISQKTGISERQKNLNNLYQAAIDGNNRRVFTFNEYEYEIIPYDLQTNYSHMVIAVQFINKPEYVEEIFEIESFEKLGVENCFQCVGRIWAMAYAYNELKEYDKTINLLEPYLDIIQDLYFVLPVLRAYVTSGNQAKVDELIKKLNFQGMETFDWLYLNLYTAREYVLKGQKAKATSYLDAILEYENQEEYEFLLAQAYIEKENFLAAETLYTKLNNIAPNNFHILVGLATSYFKNGKIDESDAIIEQLDNLRGPYQYGVVDYRLAQIYALRKEENKVFEHLLKSIAAGHRLTDEKFKNSSFFVDYLDSDKWDEVLTYWH